jgi:hypothetical protein
MGWAARANHSAEKAAACGYQKPRRITLGKRQFRMMPMGELMRRVRLLSLLQRKKTVTVTNGEAA